MRPEVEALELEGYAAPRGASTYASLLALPVSQFERLPRRQRRERVFFARRLFHRLSARHQGVPAGGGEPGSPFRKGE